MIQGSWKLWVELPTMPGPPKRKDLNMDPQFQEARLDLDVRLPKRATDSAVLLLLKGTLLGLRGLG